MITDVLTETEGVADGYVLFVERHRGILSQAGQDELGCFVTPDSEADPAWTFNSARFAGAGTIEATTADGATWVMTFDPKTLSPIKTIDRCTGVPD
jgi:hypothetical protein